MSLNEQQTHETGDTAGMDEDNLTRTLKIICTAWVMAALLTGIAFVALRDVFLSLV
jgi:hypothetical protein